MKLFLIALMAMLSCGAFAGNRVASENGPGLAGPYVLKPFPGYGAHPGGTAVSPGDQTDDPDDGGDTNGDDGPGGGPGGGDQTDPTQANKRSAWQMSHFPP